jgi:gliding motility-associated-like protein
MIYKKVIACALFLVIGISFSYAQSWFWGRQATPKSSGGIVEDQKTDHTIAVDKNGNAYLTGGIADTTSFNSVTLNTAYRVPFLVKYDVNGNVIWGASGASMNIRDQGIGQGVATDESLNVYYCGQFGDTIIFATDTLRLNHTDCSFLVKYDANGNIQWAEQSGSATRYGVSDASSVIVDNNYNSFITGSFEDTVGFGLDTLRNSSSSSNDDVFLVKYDPNGNALWARQATLGSPNSNGAGNSVAVDKAGNSYVGGVFTDTITFGAFTLRGTQSTVPFLVKYDRNGNVLWAKQGIMTGTSPQANLLSISVDASAHIYATGNFTDSVSFGNFTLRSVMPGATYSAFLVKYDSSGNVIWAKQTTNLSTSPLTLVEGSSVICDTLSRGGCFFTWFAYHELAYGTDTFHLSAGVSTVIMHVDSAGNPLCSSSFSENNEDDGDGIGAAPSGKYVYITGDYSNFGLGGINHLVVFGNDTLHGLATEEYFVARWQLCCGPINDSVHPFKDTCNSPDGMAIVHASSQFSPFTYSWSPAGGTDSTAHGLSAGKYVVTFTDVNGCKKIDSTIVRDTNIALINVCCDTILSTGSSVTLSVGPAGKYLWTPTAGLNCDTCPNPVASPTITTKYYVTLTNRQGCSSRDSVLITLEENKTCGNIFVPNAFSPNGDNIDDIEYVYGGCIEALDFKIFDRWGNLVFETTDPTKGWNGTWNGQPMNSGVYDYTLVAVQSNGKSTDQKGCITLVR